MSQDHVRKQRTCIGIKPNHDQCDQIGQNDETYEQLLNLAIFEGLFKSKQNSSLANFL